MAHVAARSAILVVGAWFLFAAPLSARAGSPRHERAAEDEFSYALIEDEHETVCAINDERDWENVASLEDRFGHPVLWFRLKRDRFVLRDRAALARAHALVAPMTRLGREQGELARTMTGLGARQAALGTRQAQAEEHLDQSSDRLEAVRARIARSRSRGSGVAALERERSTLEREIARLRSVRASLAREEESLAASQETLSRRLDALGRDQENASAAAHRGILRLCEDAVAARSVERVHD